VDRHGRKTAISGFSPTGFKSEHHSVTEALRLFDRNANYASLHDAKRTGSAQRYINYTAFDERPAIIDSAAD
jgi:hypothetical protein